MHLSIEESKAARAAKAAAMSAWSRVMAEADIASAANLKQFFADYARLSASHGELLAAAKAVYETAYENPVGPDHLFNLAALKAAIAEGTNAKENNHDD